jgi:hypothetical protein
MKLKMDVSLRHPEATSYFEKDVVFRTVLWIRIRIGSGFSDFVDPGPYWESGSGSKGKKMKKFQWKNALFSYFEQKILPQKRYKIALTTGTY